MRRWWDRVDLSGNPRQATRVAAALWLVLAVVVWNVVFDRMLVLAGRRFVHAAAVTAGAGQPYLLVDPWMRAATAAAFRTATWVATSTLLAGGVAILLASRLDSGMRRPPSVAHLPTGPRPVPRAAD